VEIAKLRQIDVLIIEDEEDICYLLSGILRKKNLNTSYVTTLFAAREVLMKRYPHILFLDNHLPDGYGVDFLSFIKRDYPNTKVIMITAHDTGDDKQKAIKEGADYFIGKPFTRDTIIKTVDTLISDLTL
jgi:DNA-binding NtrC family response regulator